MGFLDTLQRQQQAPKSMMGRANFGIQRPSPRVRLDKFKATLDPRFLEQQNVEVAEDVQTPREDIDLSLDVNKDIPLGNDLPSNGGITGNGGFVQRKNDSESQIANILAEISGIQGKDYGPRKKGGFKDILASLGIGALQGVASADPRGGIGAILGGALGGGAAGGIGGAVDGSTDNKMRDRMKLDRLYGEYGQASKVADAELNRKYRRTQMENIDKDNAARDAAALAKAEKEKREFGLKEKTFNFKVEDRAEYYRLEEMKIDALKQNRKDLYELAVRKQDEIERNNQVKTDQTERKGMPKNNVPLPPSSISVGTPAPKGRPKKDPLGIFK